MSEAAAPIPPREAREPAFAPRPEDAPPADEHAPAPWDDWWGSHLAETRWQAELARLTVDPVFYGRGVPHGDGRAVIAIPGFLAGDTSLSVMRSWLKRIGYAAEPSGIAVNVDCSDLALDRLEGRLLAVARRSGRRVALLGHSRGGHFAKALAARHPDLVACVISMGAGLDTPFAISKPTAAALAAVRAWHQRIGDRAASRGCMTASCDCRFALDYASAFPEQVPLTSIYSQGDGVVWWQACVVDYAANVEVTGSHVGLAFNRKSYAAVAAALATASAR